MTNTFANDCVVDGDITANNDVICKNLVKVLNGNIVVSDVTVGHKPGIHFIGNGDGGGIFANPSNTNENIDIASSVDISVGNEGNELITCSQYKGTININNPVLMYNQLINRITLMNSSGGTELKSLTVDNRNILSELDNLKALL